MKADLLDAVLPRLTIQHRISLLKFLLVPVSIIVAYITRKVTPSRSHIMALKVSYLRAAHYGEFEKLAKSM